MPERITNKTPGQSLLEMIFAIAILILVVIALLAATSAGVGGQKASEFQVISNNLARESIEVVRSIRDGNWLAGENWDQGLNSVTNAITIFDPSATENAWQLITGGSSQLFLDDGVYTHIDSPSAQPSAYSRTVEIESICKNDLGAESIATNCDVADTRIGIQVVVEVSWVDRGRDSKVEISDLLYAWR